MPSHCAKFCSCFSLSKDRGALNEIVFPKGEALKHPGFKEPFNEEQEQQKPSITLSCYLDHLVFASDQRAPLVRWMQTNQESTECLRNQGLLCWNKSLCRVKVWNLVLTVCTRFGCIVIVVVGLRSNQGLLHARRVSASHIIWKQDTSKLFRLDSVS